jgi:hypothetical protein
LKDQPNHAERKNEPMTTLYNGWTESAEAIEARKRRILATPARKNCFKVTYHDGTSYTTQANGTLAEFAAYLMQFGGVDVTENFETGEETRRYIVQIEQVNE